MMVPSLVRFAAYFSPLNVTDTCIVVIRMRFQHDRATRRHFNS